jgi:hypothetical protein
MSIQPQETDRRATASELCAILAEVAAAIRAAPEVASPGVEVLTEDQGDIDTAIAQAVGNLGACVLVMFSGVTEVKSNLPGPVFGAVRLTVEVSENALVNRGAGGVTSLETAEAIARLLHQRRLASNRLLLVESLQHYPSPPAPADVCYHLNLRTSEVSIHRKATP